MSMTSHQFQYFMGKTYITATEKQPRRCDLTPIFSLSGFQLFPPRSTLLSLPIARLVKDKRAAKAGRELEKAEAAGRMETNVAASFMVMVWQ